MSILFLLAAGSPSEWKLVLQKNGVKVFLRPVTDSRIKEYRAETLVEADAETVLRKITEVETLPQWVAYCNRSELIHRAGPDDFIVYSQIDVPFPAADRDLIQKFEVKESETGFEIRVTALPHLRPEATHFIRMKRADGIWRLTHGTKKGTTNVEMQFINDPGGSIPDWFINAMIAKSPYQTIQGLKEVLESDTSL